MERYIRQMSIPEIGPEGQKKLAQARVLIVGAGGLGSPVLFYLAAAGVGTLAVVEDDTVALSNLNRQILYTEKDLGKAKIASAAQRLKALRPDLSVHEHALRLNRDNAPGLIADYDIVVDCVDRLETRQVVNQAALALDKKVVEGGIHGFYGFVLTVKRGEACAACMQPLPGLAQDGSAGMAGGIPALGATAGVAGSLQAAECLKLLLGIGQPLYSRLLFFDLLRMDFDEIALSPAPHCPVCGSFTKTSGRAHA